MRSAYVRSVRNACVRSCNPFQAPLMAAPNYCPKHKTRLVKGACPRCAEKRWASGEIREWQKSPAAAQKTRRTPSKP